MNKDARPRNGKGQAHGYWETYYDELMCKCFYHNNILIGYYELYGHNITYIGFNIS